MNTEFKIVAYEKKDKSGLDSTTSKRTNTLLLWYFF